MTPEKMRGAAKETALNAVSSSDAGSTTRSGGEGVRKAIAAAIAKADESFGYSFNLTRLVDGEETYTLLMSGFEPAKFENRDDGYRLIAERRNAARSDAVIAALA